MGLSDSDIAVMKAMAKTMSQRNWVGDLIDDGVLRVVDYVDEGGCLTAKYWRSLKMWRDKLSCAGFDAEWSEPGRCSFVELELHVSSYDPDLGRLGAAVVANGRRGPSYRYAAYMARRLYVQMTHPQVEVAAHFLRAWDTINTEAGFADLVVAARNCAPG